MSLELLGNNIESEKNIIEELALINEKIENGDENYIKSGRVNILLDQLKIINEALPELLENIPFYKTFKNKENKQLVSLNIKTENKEINLGIKKDKEKEFLKNFTRGFSGKGFSSDEGNSFIGISNKLFRKYSENLVQAGYFDNIKEDLRKITSPIIISSYLSLILFCICLAFVFAILIAMFLLFFKASIVAVLLVVFLIPIIIFISFYIYPSSARKSLEKNINQELPFLTIYMSAIATSGIEPSKIFSIIAVSNDYPFTRREIKKLINYINFYGYDLVSALRQMAKNSPSERLALLFDGLSTTITSGGELTAFLNKHSETLLFDYRLEREKYTQVAETFMDIYISVVIAAPMMLMMLFVLMSVTGFNSFLTTQVLSVLMILIIALINIGFILFLNIKQPKF